MCDRSNGACAVRTTGRMRPVADGCMHPSELRHRARSRVRPDGRIPSAAYKAHVTDSIEQLSFGFAIGELAEQERALAALRTCAGTILAAASVAGSFLAAGARHGSLGALGVLAMASFVLCSGSAIWVLLPHTFVFAFRGRALLYASDRQPCAEAAEAYRAAGAWIAPLVAANRTKLRTLAECLTVSCVLLALEVTLWTIVVLV